jgi:hypothetical protein
MVPDISLTTEYALQAANNQTSLPFQQPPKNQLSCDRSHEDITIPHTKPARWEKQSYFKPATPQHNITCVTRAAIHCTVHSSVSAEAIVVM